VGSRLTREQFIERAARIHHNKYGYDLVRYRHGKAKILIVCPTHGVFEQNPDKHLQGRGCRKCGGTSPLGAVDFIREAKKINGEKYNYSLSVYTNIDSPVVIVCAEHGPFQQTPYKHIRLGRGCRKCGDKKAGNSIRLTQEEFLAKAKTRHGDLYGYELVDYKETRIPIKITCFKHGTFEQKPMKHLQGYGCPTCSASKGEIAIRRFLEGKEIAFKHQARIIPSQPRMSFDFQIDRTLVEFHGQQHYRVVDFTGHNPAKAKKAFRAGQRRDRFKAKWAAENGYELIVIPYWESVEEVLTKRLPKKAA